jgi:hypothetical protein
MSAPVISTASSILGFRRREQFAFTPAATNNPLFWTASGLPPGVSIETFAAKSGITGDQATDVITSTGHGYEDGQIVFFPSLTGGSGLTANTWYYVRDTATDTFKVSAVPGGAAVDFTTAITAGQVRRVSTGRISGSSDVAGVHVVTVTATNGTGASAAQQFVFGFSSEVAPDVGGLLDAIPVVIKLPTCEVSGPGGGGIVFPVKGGDLRMLVVRFEDEQGLRVDPDPATLKFTMKELEPDRGFVETTAFEKTGSGATAEFMVPVDLSSSRLRGAFAGNETDQVTGFNALAEFEWTRTVTFNSASLTLRASTPNFPVRADRDLTKNS